MHSLKYQRFATLDCKDKEMRKSDFVANIHNSFKTVRTEYF